MTRSTGQARSMRWFSGWTFDGEAAGVTLAGVDVVGAESGAQIELWAGKWTEAATAIALEDGDCVLIVAGDVALIGDDDEVGDAVSSDVAHKNLPGFGACREG